MSSTYASHQVYFGAFTLGLNKSCIRWPNVFPRPYNLKVPDEILHMYWPTHCGVSFSQEVHERAFSANMFPGFRIRDIRHSARRDPLIACKMTMWFGYGSAMFSLVVCLRLWCQSHALLSVKERQLVPNMQWCSLANQLQCPNVCLGLIKM